jgi:MFS transporter, SP family, sugar:H+ symporter
LGFGILFFPETPRHDFRFGQVERASKSIAKLYGVSENHSVIQKQLEEMQYKLQMEREGGDHSIWEVFTGPRMRYRTLLGIAIQVLQQMTGANFFFYYGEFERLSSVALHPNAMLMLMLGTTIFTSVGLSNPFVTQIILGAVNVVTTFPGLYMVEKFGRRKCLTLGAAWMFSTSPPRSLNTLSDHHVANTGKQCATWSSPHSATSHSKTPTAPTTRLSAWL